VSNVQIAIENVLHASCTPTRRSKCDYVTCQRSSHSCGSGLSPAEPGLPAKTGRPYLGIRCSSLGHLEAAASTHTETAEVVLEAVRQAQLTKTL
jgi:hypothetical protein